MKKRNLILVAVAVVVVLGGLAWVVLREPPEPVYQGKKLSEWLCRYVHMGHGNSEEAVSMAKADHEVDEVVRHIGTNAIPTLFQMLNATDPPLKKLAYWADKDKHYPFNFTSLWASAQRSDPTMPFLPAFAQRYGAAVAFRALGADARDAVPRLIDIYNRNRPDGSQELAALALGGIGPAASNAVPSLLRVVTNAVPSRVPYDSLRALGEIHAEPEKVVPVLVKCLKDPDVNVRRRALHSLQDFGANARPAVPALIESLSDSVDYIRKAATNALKQIDPEAASKAGVNVPQTTNSSIKTQVLIDLVEVSTNRDSWSWPEYAEYSDRLYELQKRADIVVQAESLNFETVKIIKCTIEGDFPKVAFPISDLTKYFPPGAARHKPLLAIFYAPWDYAFVVDPKKPGPDLIMRGIGGNGGRKVRQGSWV